MCEAHIKISSPTLHSSPSFQCYEQCGAMSTKGKSYANKEHIKDMQLLLSHTNATNINESSLQEVVQPLVVGVPNPTNATKQ